jgi:hypothetical protein
MPLAAAYDSRISNQRALTKYTVATGQTFYEGGLVQLDSSGNLITLLTASALKCVGQFVRLSPDLKTAEVREGDITLDNAAVNPCVQATVGAACYGADDYVATNTAGSSAKIGVVVGFTADSKVIVRCTLATT